MSGPAGTGSSPGRLAARRLVKHGLLDRRVERNGTLAAARDLGVTIICPAALGSRPGTVRETLLRVFVAGVWAWPPQPEHLADAQHFGSAGAGADGLAEVRALGPVRSAYSYLDEFVGRECPVDLGHDLVGQAGVPDLHDRLQWVGAGFQVAPFAVCE